MSTRQVRRGAERLMCDIPARILIGTMSRPGRIVDITRFGAQVQMGRPYEEGVRIEVEVSGQKVEAEVRWREAGRMGIQFIENITEGPMLRHIDALNQSMFGATTLPGMRQTTGERAK